MSIHLYSMDWQEFVKSSLIHKPDAIVTDPVYENLPRIEDLLDACNGNVLVFCDPKRRPNKIGDEILHWIKTPSTKNTTRNCSRFVEEIHVYRRGGVFNRLHWSCMTGVFHDNIQDYPSLHPWQKPTSLMEKLVQIYTNYGDVVFDPFTGSGTTGLACRLTGRSFVGCEIDPIAYQTARSRLIG